MPQNNVGGAPPQSTDQTTPDRQLQLENKVFRRLFRRHCMGGKHMSFESLCGGIPKSDYGLVKGAIEIF